MSGFVSRSCLCTNSSRVRQQHMVASSAATPRLHSVRVAAGARYGNNEKVYELSDLLKECEGLDDVLEDEESSLPVWEHEHRVRALPFTEEELLERQMLLERQQQQQQHPEQHLPDDTGEWSDSPLAAPSDIPSAYSADQGFREMSVSELSVGLTAGGLIDLLLDVRTQQEFDAGPRIPTAVNIPLDQLSDAVRAGQLDPFITGSIAVVCASGQRSAQATVRLSRVFGFLHVVNVAGGMSAWQQLQEQLRPGGSDGAGGGCGCGGGGAGGCHG